MDTMIHGKYFNQGEDLSAVLNMRRSIFGADRDERDAQAVNLLVRLVKEADDPGVDIGCGRLNLDLDRFRFEIDYLGIEEEFRRNGFGEFALRALVDKVNQCGAERVYVKKELVTSDEAAAFLKKMFFEQAEEKEFLCAKVDSFHTCCH